MSVSQNTPGKSQQPVGPPSKPQPQQTAPKQHQPGSAEEQKKQAHQGQPKQ